MIGTAGYPPYTSSAQRGELGNPLAHHMYISPSQPRAMAGLLRGLGAAAAAARLLRTAGGARGLATQARALVFSQTGDPQKVLRLESLELPAAVGAGEVAVEMLLAPINPADMNMVEGSYPLKPKLPAVGGNEGVGRVTAAGAGSGLAVGDLVVPRAPLWGTWRTANVCQASQLTRVPEGFGAEAAATLSVNPCTALRMLEDFADLKEGDVVIQNGANSAVGQAVIQIARSRGVRTVNLLRRREGIGAVEDHLRALGADVVTFEDSLRSDTDGLPKAKLALNCVGGKASAACAKMLEPGGVMVTYGGMSRQPATVPTGLLIFKDITARGFWLSRWVDEHSPAERTAMFEALRPLVLEGKLSIRTKEFSLDDFESAVRHETTGGYKAVLRMAH